MDDEDFIEDDKLYCNYSGLINPIWYDPTFKKEKEEEEEEEEEWVYNSLYNS